MFFNAVFEVPDDTVIDQSVKPKLLFHKMDGESSQEEIADCVLEPLVDLSKISDYKVTDDSVIIFKFDDDDPGEEVQGVRDVLQQAFPNNKVLGLNKHLEFMSVENSDMAVEMLNKMIAHIRVTADTKTIQV